MRTLLLLSLPALLAPLPAAPRGPEGAVGLALAPGGWRNDPAWNDGRAEVCTYDATLAIYGAERRYEARAYTDQEHVDSELQVKSESDAGLAVFKHHWSERVPTESYDYDFSTMVYARVADLALYKLTAATQDDCGASFKELVAKGDGFAWLESVYFPGAGARRGELRGAPNLVAADQLTLVLRDYPFAERPELALALLPSQKSNRRVPFEPVPRTVRYGARERLALPAGEVDAHRLELCTPDGAVEARYWFAAEGAAPWLHALVQYEGPLGASYRLRAIERRAYWERG